MVDTILAGDVGGTKTNLVLHRAGDSAGPPLHKATFRTADYSGLEPILEEFLQGQPRPVAAAFGVAGPVSLGRVQLTNVAWPVVLDELQRFLAISRVDLINDLVATAYGICILPESGFELLHAGVPDATGNAAVIAAGTGLGEALLFWNGRRLQPMASEGGHSDFAPRTDEEIELLRHLRRKHGRVSSERILSGRGFYAIYEFLRDTGRGTELPEIAEQLRSAISGNSVPRPVSRRNS